MKTRKNKQKEQDFIGYVELTSYLSERFQSFFDISFKIRKNSVNKPYLTYLLVAFRD